jgi:hypothetical protein
MSSSNDAFAVNRRIRKWFVCNIPGLKRFFFCGNRFREACCCNFCNRCVVFQPFLLRCAITAKARALPAQIRFCGLPCRSSFGVMKTKLLLWLLILTSPLAADSPKSGGYEKQDSGIFDNMLFTVGISAGRETFIGLPKLGAYKEFSLLSQRPLHGRKQFSGFGNCSFYAGAEASIFVIFAGVFSVSADAGFAFGPLTIDNSLTRSVIVSPDGGENSYYTTCNPKLGLNIGPVWLKAGPSYAVGKSDAAMGNWLKKGNNHYNVELLYIVRY